MRSFKELAAEWHIDEAKIRSAAVDLLMTVAHAIEPSSEDEQRAVEWLKQTIATEAHQILHGGEVKQTKSSKTPKKENR